MLRYNPVLVLFLLAALGCNSTKNKLQANKEEQTLSLEEEIVLSEREKREPSLQMNVDFGYFFTQIGNTKKATECFRNAIKQNKKAPEPYIGLVKMYMQMQNPDEALAILEQAMKTCKKSPELLNELAVVQMARNEPQLALKAIEQALELAPDSPLYTENYASMLAAAGDYSKSLTYFSKLMTPSDARYRIAGIAYSKGDLEQSRMQLELALQANPQHQLSVAMLQRISGNEINQVGYLVPESKHGLQSTSRR